MFACIPVSAPCLHICLGSCSTDSSPGTSAPLHGFPCCRPQDVNIWWLPDEVERIIYFNVMTLMLQVLDEVVEGMSINFAGVSKKRAKQAKKAK